MGFKTFLEFIKVEHSLFSLPFIYSGTLLAMHHAQMPLAAFWSYFLWVTLAAVGARTAAMAINRIIDRNIDAKNPRTKERALPAKKLSLDNAYLITIISCLLLFVSAYMLNDLAYKLAGIPLVFFILYPYMKRISWLSHLVLGVSWAIGPLGGWIAVTGSFVDFSIPLALALSGALWVTGFDIIYSILDVKFDKAEKLYSIPAIFGIDNGLKMSFLLHVGMFFPLLYIYQATRLGFVYLVSLLAAFVLIAYEHRLSKNRDEKQINKAFFDVNAIVGWVILIGIIGGIIY